MKLVLWITLWALAKGEASPSECKMVMLKEEAVCEDRPECEGCSVIQARECTINMREVWVTQNITRCSRGGKFIKGCPYQGRRICNIKFRSKCSTSLVYRVIEEDFPNCRTETVKSCRETLNTENLVEPEDNCDTVEVNRCQIAKRKVRRAQPNTVCKRLPYKECLKENCGRQQEACRKITRLVRELQPEENCKFTPRKMCRSDQNSSCTGKVSRVCRKVEEGAVRMQLVCNGTLQGPP